MVFHLDRIPPFDAATQLARNPRGMEDLAPVGVFAQRTKFRPNPIGVTAVELLAVDDKGITVRGLDALDGTPVLDIKPYIPAVRAQGRCASAGVGGADDGRVFLKWVMCEEKKSTPTPLIWMKPYHYFCESWRTAPLTICSLVDTLV